MKIALIYLGRHGSGGPISYQLVTHLRAHVDVFAVISRFTDNRSVWQSGAIPVIEVNTYTSAGQAVLSTLNIHQHYRLLSLIAAEKPDVLFFPMLHLWSPVIQWGLRRIPNVVTIHDPEPHPGIVAFAAWHHGRVAMRLATRCIVLSNCFVTTLEHLGIPRQKIDVIPHGELSSYYAELSPPTVPVSGQPTILFFGRIEPYKGLGVLLEAFRKVEQEVPNARLLIAGAGDLKPYQDQIARLTRVEIDNRWIPDELIASYFRRAQIVVVPYTSATQSGIIAIATGLGTPVIASRVGGLCEQIEHGKTGILVEPGSVDELAEWCLRLLRDPVLAQNLAAEAKHRALSHFSWSSIAEQVLHSCELAIRQPD